MAKQDALFLLVKSLSQGEKTAVRQIDQKDSGYIALFDLISRSNDFDERKFKKKLQSLGHDLNFSYAKNYLTKHILRILRETRASNGMDRTVQEIQILMDRKVFSLAEKMLGKARETAWAEERWVFFLDLTNIEITLLLQGSGDVQDGVEQVQRINRERAQARANLQILGDYEDLYALYRPVVKRKQIARNALDLDLIRELRENHLLSSPHHGTTARVKRIYLQCMIMIHLYSGEYQAATDLIKEQLSHAREHPFLIQDLPAEYLNDLLRLGGMQLHFKQFAEVTSILEQIQTFQHQHGLHGVELFDKYYRLLIGLALETKNANVVLPAYDLILDGLQTYRDSLQLASRMTFMALLARLQFEQGNYTEARLLLEGIIEYAQPGVREDIAGIARIMLVFIYAEKGDHDLAEAASKAVRKYLQRREQLFAFERRILRFFEKNADFVGTKNEVSNLKELKSDLDKIFENPLEANVLTFFDIQGWLHSRIQKIKS